MKETVAAAAAGTVTNSNEERFQLGGWSDRTNQIQDPLTEFIEIKGQKVINGTLMAAGGTGSFLQECRIYTALHVLLLIEKFQPGKGLEEGESLKGHRFEFETGPIPGSNETKKGHFVVIAHGDLRGSDTEANSEQDWAVGYDSECTSEKYKLGYVILARRETFVTLKQREYLTAGFSKIPAAMKDGAYHLYVDSKCHVSKDVEENYKQSTYFVSDCSVGPWGSGQMLVTPNEENGKLEMGPNGQPQLYAFGMFLTVAPKGTKLVVPNVESPVGFAAFTREMYKKVSPYLTGPVDVQKVIRANTQDQ